MDVLVTAAGIAGNVKPQKSAQKKIEMMENRFDCCSYFVISNFKCLDLFHDVLKDCIDICTGSECENCIKEYNENSKNCPCNENCPGF